MEGRECKNEEPEYDLPPPGAPRRSATVASRLIGGFTRRSGSPRLGLEAMHDIPLAYMMEPEPAGEDKNPFEKKMVQQKHTFRMLGYLHSKAAKKSEWWHNALTIVVIVLALAVGVIPETLELFPFWECSWSMVIILVLGGLITAVTAFKDTFGFQKDAERHEEVRREYDRLVGLIDAVLLRFRECPEEGIDLEAAYQEVQAAKDNLTRGGRIDLPYSLEKRYEHEIYPWLAHQRAHAADVAAEATRERDSFFQRLRGISAVRHPTAKAASAPELSSVTADSDHSAETVNSL